MEPHLRVALIHGRLVHARQHHPWSMPLRSLLGLVAAAAVGVALHLPVRR